MKVKRIKKYDAGGTIDQNFFGNADFKAGKPRKVRMFADGGGVNLNINKLKQLPTQTFDTPLNEIHHNDYQNWLNKNGVNDFDSKGNGYDYDYKGAFLAGINRDGGNGHFPDTFKKPNHETFSDESQYANMVKDLPKGHWDNDKFVKYAPDYNVSTPIPMSSNPGSFGKQAPWYENNRLNGPSITFPNPEENMIRADGGSVQPMSNISLSKPYLPNTPTQIGNSMNVIAEQGANKLKKSGAMSPQAAFAYRLPQVNPLFSQGGYVGKVKFDDGGSIEASDAASGALSGAATGATIGSVIPGIGTAIGAVGGALIGGTAGFFKGKNDYDVQQQKLAQQSNSTNLMNLPPPAYGSKFSDGGGIHIQKSHEGRFHEYASRNGLSMTEAIAKGKNSSDPHVRKMATFAANARTWKHEDGGLVNPHLMFAMGGHIDSKAEEAREPHQTINVEKNELETHKGRLVNDFMNKPKHPLDGSMNPQGNTVAQKGNTIIPAHMRSNYMSADLIKRAKIESGLKKDQNTRQQFANRKMADGGVVDPTLLYTDPAEYARQSNLSPDERSFTITPDAGNSDYANQYSFAQKFQDAKNTGNYGGVDNYNGMVPPKFVYPQRPNVDINQQFPTPNTDNPTGWQPVRPINSNPLGDNSNPQISQGLNKINNTPNNINYGDIASKFVPYASNIANALLTANTPKYTPPVLTNHIGLNDRLEIRPSLDDIAANAQGTLSNIASKTNSGGIYRSSAGDIYGKEQSERNKVFANAANYKNGINNQQTIENNNIDQKNNALTNDYNLNQRQRLININENLSKNFSNATEKFQGQQHDQALMDNDMTKAAMVYKIFDQNGVLDRAGFDKLVSEHPEMKSKFMTWLSSYNQSKNNQ